MNARTANDVDFQKIITHLLSLLTEKERDIIHRRFAIAGQKKETLHKIGEQYAITRERIRQIEAAALRKLTRIAMDPEVRLIHEIAVVITHERDGITPEEVMVSEILRRAKNPDMVDINALKLVLQISPHLNRQDKNQFFKPFWFAKDLGLVEIREHVAQLKRELNKDLKTKSIKDFAKAIPHLSPKFIESLLQIDFNFLETSEGWGLKAWRFLNPRSIKDRIEVSLQQNSEPMHFGAITDAVLNNFKNGKKVTRQAVHNELIRHDDFVLVGRGLYGLKSWGLTAGTVCEVIKQVLVEQNEPMKRQEIIDEVLKRRQVQVGTISLNLQKYPFFERVGRAVYQYNPALEKN